MLVFCSPEMFSAVVGLRVHVLLWTGPVLPSSLWAPKVGDWVCLFHPLPQCDLSHYLADRMAESRKGGWDYMREGAPNWPVSSLLEYL